jgi:hypothetical protein
MRSEEKKTTRRGVRGRSEKVVLYSMLQASSFPLAFGLITSVSVACHNVISHHLSSALSNLYTCSFIDDILPAPGSDGVHPLHVEDKVEELLL